MVNISTVVEQLTLGVYLTDSQPATCDTDIYLYQPLTKQVLLNSLSNSLQE